MQTVYCISGLGADEGVFQYLDLSFVKPVFIKWITPLQDETLSSYAMRLKQKFIHDEKPVIIGLSLGGMIAVEMAKSLPSAKTVIISSAKTVNEIPYYWKMFQYVPVYKILPQWSIKRSLGIQQYFLGAYSNVSKQYIIEALEKADAEFYRWAIGAILTWQNQIVPSNIIHIHGINDRILPYKFVKPNISINKGGHLMIMENADEISSLIRNIVAN
ncbi:MAG TPA: alpha/beta hydrolase [Chitinophagaceae bacterium]